jgi:hypothetical protein
MFVIRERLYAHPVYIDARVCEWMGGWMDVDG